MSLTPPAAVIDFTQVPNSRIDLLDGHEFLDLLDPSVFARLLDRARKMAPRRRGGVKFKRSTPSPTPNARGGR
jgi:hypothetical protein